MNEHASPFESSLMNCEKNESLLRLEKAGVKRDNKWLVRDIDLELQRGKIVTLIGPNGSGKSTTAKMVLGIYSPSQGKLWRKAKIKIGYVPQKLTIDASLPLTVYRLMTLTATLDKPTLLAALNETGATHLLYANIANLSGGELQRVLLARAIARHPDLLVLDEPLQGVDYQGESELYNLIAHLRTKLNCAILLISHDLHIVMAKTDRVLCLNGHICCSGTPEDVAASDAYTKLMRPHGESELALYQHHHDHRHNLRGEMIKDKTSPCDEHCHDHRPKNNHGNIDHA